MNFKVYIFIYLYLVFIYIHILHISFYLYIGIYKNIFLLYYILLSIGYSIRARGMALIYSWESRRLRDEENHHTPLPPSPKRNPIWQIGILVFGSHGTYTHTRARVHNRVCTERFFRCWKMKPNLFVATRICPLAEIFASVAFSCVWLYSYAPYRL